jgi:hypothetical protein
MKTLRIFHQPETTPDEWPSQFKNTFRNVVALGSFKFHAYDEMPNDHSTPSWRQATKLRAKQLSNTARRLLKEKPSELTWRLEIEKLVDARFSLRTEWYVESDLATLQARMATINTDSLMTVKFALDPVVVVDLGDPRLKLLQKSMGLFLMI